MIEDSNFRNFNDLFKRGKNGEIYEMIVVDQGTMVSNVDYNSPNLLALYNTSLRMIEENEDSKYFENAYLAHQLTSPSLGTTELKAFITAKNPYEERITVVDIFGSDGAFTNFDNNPARFKIPNTKPIPYKNTLVWSNNLKLVKHVSRNGYDTRFIVKRLSIPQMLDISKYFRNYYHFLIQKKEGPIYG